MKDRNTPHELARSVLQFLKIASSILDEGILKTEGDIGKLMLENLFQFKTNIHVKKHRLIVRKILTRLIRRCGLNFVTRIMPEFHRPMLAYIEKQKRKSENKKEKNKLLALMGGNPETAMKEDGDSEDEISSDEEMVHNDLAKG